ncbi:Uncharacterised protein [Mycobacteroides abscessus subsp. abscessus]|nr:Uncharacterised protein [Mycobacteroides abscessus subsp. abscessus]
MNNDQPKASPRARRVSVTASICLRISRQRATPIMGGLPRRSFTQRNTRTPIPSSISGREATAWARSRMASKPPTLKIKEKGLVFAPKRNAPPRPRIARPTACSTPDITSCQDATTGVAPHSRCCR